MNNDDFSDVCNSDDDDFLLDSVCPFCYEEYDEIDFEFQICHLCGFNNNTLDKPNEET